MTMAALERPPLKQLDKKIARHDRVDVYLMVLVRTDRAIKVCRGGDLDNTTWLPLSHAVEVHRGEGYVESTVRMPRWLYDQMKAELQPETL